MIYKEIVYITMYEVRKQNYAVQCALVHSMSTADTCVFPLNLFNDAM
jgi:hypothetical protein